MKNFASGCLIVVVVLALSVVSLFYQANTFVDLNEEVSLQWAQVESSLLRRSELIPNLVNTVKGAANHELAVFTEIANARKVLVDNLGTNNYEAVEEANKALDISIDRLTTLVAEDYPALASTQLFIGLMDELAGTENRINVARNYYNEAVREYNTAVKKFPKNIIARVMGYESIDYFEVAEEDKEAPIVSFE